MKQKIGYSRGTGAIIVFVVLFLIICFFDATTLGSLYRSHIQPAFGKTHFIVGYKDDDKQHGSVVDAGSYRILFAPDDDLQTELIKLINAEQESIKIAIFTFTDVQVAHAIIDAHQRGVHIEIVSDAAYLKDQYSKIALLQSNKIPVYTYNPHYKNVSKKKQDLLSIMHNKFAIFSKNGSNKQLVWTGSFNFTRSANLRNQENVVILEDRSAVKKYEQQFNRLKKRCDNCFEESIAIA